MQNNTKVAFYENQRRKIYEAYTGNWEPKIGGEGKIAEASKFELGPTKKL
jgi:hypothetical protein